MRLGIYFNLSEFLKSKKQQNMIKTLSIQEKTICSLIAGSVGSFFGTPFDLILVRMQADRRIELPESMRRNYKNVFEAFTRISKEEGIQSLWTGGLITITRACSMNIFMLVSYEESKERLSRNLPLTFS